MKNVPVIIIMTVGLFLILALLPGCGRNLPQEEEITYFYLATGGLDSFHESLGREVAARVNKEDSRIHIKTESTAGPEANLRILSKEGLQLAITTSDLAYHARKGAQMYQHSEPIKFLTLASLGSEPLLILSPATEELKDIEGLAGKKISLGRGEGRTQLLSRYLLDALAVELDTNETLFYGAEEALLALDEKKLAAAFLLNPFSPGERNIPYSPLPLTEKMQKLVTSKYPFFLPETLPAGIFLNQETEILTLAVDVILVAISDLDEDLMDELSRSLKRAGFNKKPLTDP